jgi:1-acyl-sn-glycerol-3-phosphate acyltransferase
LGNRIFRALIRPIFRLLMHILCRIQIEGRHNVPREGAYLVVINHVSLYEAPLLIAFWPKPIEAAGAKEVLERPFQGDLMRGYGGLAVDRGRVDRKLLRNMVNLLKHGFPLLIAPEGQRSHVPGMGKAWNGAAYVAGKASVPLVPVGITGTENGPDLWKQLRRPLWRMVIGEPFTLPPVPWATSERKQVLNENTETVMRKIAELLPPEYRGVYG